LAEDSALLGQHDAAVKLGAALTLSVLLHLAVIYGIRVVPPRSSGTPSVVIQARLVKPKVVPQIQAQVVPQDAVQSVSVEQKTEPTPAPANKAPEPEQPAPPATGGVDTAQSASPITLEAPLQEDPTYYPGKQVDVHPRALQPIRPAYPDNAFKEGAQGIVILLLMIDELGVIRDVSVAEATPQGYFEESAMQAFRGKRFTPAIKGGRAVKSRVLIRVQYDLTNYKPAPPAVPESAQ